MVLQHETLGRIAEELFHWRAHINFLAKRQTWPVPVLRAALAWWVIAGFSVLSAARGVNTGLCYGSTIRLAAYCSLC